MVCLPVAVNTRVAGGVAWHGVHTFRWSSPVALNQGGGAAFAWGERAGACNTDPLGSLAQPPAGGRAEGRHAGDSPPACPGDEI